MPNQTANSFASTAQIPSFPNAAGLGCVGGGIFAQLPNAGGLVQLGAAQIGLQYWVDTVNGADTNDGLSPGTAFATVAAAFAVLADNDVIYLVGDIREQVEAPVGVQGVRIIGVAGGNLRHDNGVRWREPASATADEPLLRILDQGWEVHNILFVPGDGIAAIEIRRAEDATYPDGSHLIVSHCKFIGANVTNTVGIEDIGGSHHVRVVGCEFFTLASAIVNTSTAIANPLRWIIEACVFMANTEHIDMPFTESIVRNNVFDEGTTNVEVDGGAGGNFVIDNVFQQDQADIANSDGYAGGAADVWRNFSQDTAAMTVGIPS